MIELEFWHALTLGLKSYNLWVFDDAKRQGRPAVVLMSQLQSALNASNRITTASSGDCSFNMEMEDGVDVAAEEQPVNTGETRSLGSSLILFGTDEAGKPHASAFCTADATHATAAAALMGMRTLAVETEEHRAIAAGLPQGRLFESGRAFVPFVKRAVYDRLSALAGPLPEPPPQRLVAAMPANATGRSDTKASEPVLPRSWDKVGVGSLVLVCEKIMDGWFEAEVIEDKGDDLFALRWRDWPELPPILRRRERIALLNPTVPPELP